MRKKDVFYNGNREEENSELPQGGKMKKWAKVLWITVGLVTVYFGTFFLSYNMMMNNSTLIKNSNDFKVQLEKLENENKNLKQEISDLKNRTETSAIASAVHTETKPKAPEQQPKDDTGKQNAKMGTGKTTGTGTGTGTGKTTGTGNGKTQDVPTTGTSGDKSSAAPPSSPVPDPNDKSEEPKTEKPQNPVTSPQKTEQPPVQQ